MRFYGQGLVNSIAGSESPVHGIVVTYAGGILFTARQTKLTRHGIRITQGRRSRKKGRRETLLCICDFLSDPIDHSS